MPDCGHWEILAITGRGCRARPSIHFTFHRVTYCSSTSATITPSQAALGDMIGLSPRSDLELAHQHLVQLGRRNTRCGAGWFQSPPASLRDLLLPAPPCPPAAQPISGTKRGWLVNMATDRRVRLRGSRWHRFLQRPDTAASDMTLLRRINRPHTAPVRQPSPLQADHHDGCNVPPGTAIFCCICSRRRITQQCDHRAR